MNIFGKMCVLPKRLMLGARRIQGLEMCWGPHAPGLGKQ